MNSCTVRKTLESEMSILLLEKFIETLVVTILLVLFLIFVQPVSSIVVEKPFQSVLVIFSGLMGWRLGVWQELLYRTRR